MELQKIFTEAAFNELRSQTRHGIGLERYYTGEFVFDKSQTLSLRGIYKPEGLEKKLDPDQDRDFENAILLYEAYPGLTPLMASNEAFWAYLTHCQYYEYCSKRWKRVLEREAPQVPQNYCYKSNEQTTAAVQTNMYVAYVLTHWFFLTGGRFRNALAGLWWFVHMTIDPEREDKYELTRKLFSLADLRNTAYASILFRHKPAIMGILEFYLEHPEFCDSSLQWRNRYIFHYFNRIGGVTNLFYLSKDFYKKELEQNYDMLMAITSQEQVSNRAQLNWTPSSEN